ncbi:hypothetical protein B9Z55_007813 [Caenorhabditis nigoni]|uniref:BTB domain-containing protein n=1 Tax=Caenorhabditis nigoni TaxID=1611254 RepID=A0A2G5VBP5_9PELO|nr:hypothetical protein B9Z55_007813 [Caenorhabditis nigoni]
MTEKEFSLKYRFKDVGKLEVDQEKHGPEEYHFGVIWTINIQKWDDRLAIFIHANLTDNQEIHADCTMKMLSRNKEKIELESGNKVFRGAGDQFWYSFIACEILKDEFLNDGKLEVEVKLKITKMIGFEKREELRSFGEEMKQFSDVILKVEDRKFYVSKLYLSSQSPYFATLFLGQFQESGKSEIELKDVDPDYFQCFLEVIYAEDAIDDNTVEGILQIADMYDTSLAIKKCEAFLMEKSKMGLKKKLELSAKYRLEELKKMYLTQFNRIFKTTVAADEGSRQVPRKRFRV